MSARPSRHRQQPEHSGALEVPHAPILVCGVGRAFYSDDQVGLQIAERLAASPPAGVRVAQTESPGADLLTELEGVRLLILIDSVVATPRLPCGGWLRIDPNAESSVSVRPGPAGAASAHSLNVNSALELGRATGLLPKEIWIYVVAGRKFDFGDEMSGPVNAAIPDVLTHIRADVRAWQAINARSAHATPLNGCV